jgi:hypothetical protein
MAKLRLVTSADQGALCAMLSAFPWEGMTPMPWPERLRHWWDDNPAFDESWERGWVLEEGDQLVGFFGSVPRRVAYEGNVALSANATTWWVAPEHRKLSLQLLARFTGQKARGHFNNTGSETTNKLMKAFGYGPFPGEGWTRESFLIVDPARMAAAKIRQQGQQRSIPGAGLVARLAEALSPVGTRVQELRLPAVKGPYTWIDLRRPDERFDVLAARMRARYRYTAERDRASLDWYLRGEAPERKVLIACLRGDALAGHATFLQRESGTMAELPLLDCIDLARDEDDPALLATLLAGAAEVARRRAIPLVVLRHFDDFLAHNYRDFGLFGRVGPPRRDYVKLPPLSEQRGYYLTQFHGDFFV